jgi:hypothetical protein
MEDFSDDSKIKLVATKVISTLKEILED